MSDKNRIYGDEAYFRCAYIEAIEERNKIEREKLEFEKEVCEFNKQLNIDNTKANTELPRILASYSEMIQNTNKTTEILANNDKYLKQEIDYLKSRVTELEIEEKHE